MKKMKRATAALALAIMLGFASAASAQIPPRYYWGCEYWIFGWGPFGYTTIVTNGAPPNSYEQSSQTGWLCSFIAACYYTQDINGGVQEYCG